MWTDPGRRGLAESRALNDFAPDDVPDVTPRPLDELVAWVNSATVRGRASRMLIEGIDELG